ncbi:MAG: EAL domain-containing protein [Pseudomonadota bacterium]|nr:EAL domain-containing protein [Pseudomonadota bacterium]
MEAPHIDSDMTQLIDQLNHAHHVQKQQIADSFYDGLLLLSVNLEPLLVNAKAQEYIDSRLTASNQLFDKFELYTQKRNHTPFDLHSWLQKQLFNRDHNSDHISPLLWIKCGTATQNKDLLVPVLIKAYPIQSIENKTENLMVLIQDQSLQIQAEAQIKLMEASYAGQFITDSHGYITQPNYAFSAYTGLKPETLNGMTYIDWLKKQVVLRVPFGSVMESLIEEGCWSGEVQLTPTEHTQYHAVLSLSMMTDTNRNIEHFIGVLQDITDIQEARTEIERLAYYDNLTGLANRTLLNNQIVSTLKNQPTSQSYSGLILLDLDGFKMINDTLGHALGDQLLILVSQKISELAGKDDVVARLDGDEFGVLVKEVSQDYEEAITHILGLSHKIRQSIDDRYTIRNRSLHSSASIGLYIFKEAPEDGQSDELIRHANLAMHEAKNLGGNQVFQFEDKLCDFAKQRLEMLQALNHSELDDEFQLYFQAQIDSDGNTVAAETLLRWFHPSLGLVPPGEFIPVAEEGRQIIKIGLWVMHKAFLQAKAWNEQYGQIRVSINISPIQFHEQSFVELVIGLIKFTQVNPANITLELTEGVLIRNTDLALQKIQHLVSLGFHVSIDDFGTGYSSLSYLQKLPIHELKIDQSFIRHVPENTDDVAIIESIVKLAQTKRLIVVAEGVETEGQVNYLRELSNTLLIQGYIYSKPVPANEFENVFLKAPLVDNPDLSLQPN